MTKRTGPTSGQSGRLERDWRVLTRLDSYLVPETLDDFKTLGLFEFIDVRGHKLYLADHAKPVWENLVSTLHSIVGQESISRRTVASEARAVLSKALLEAAPPSLSQVLSGLLSAIHSHETRKTVIRPILGLKLDGLSQIAHGRWRIVLFSETELESWLSRIAGGSRWKEQVREAFTNALLGRSCLFTEWTGDETIVRAQTDALGRVIINALRYGILYHLSDHHVAHQVGIELQSPPSSANPDSFLYDSSTSDLKISFDGGRRQDYELSKSTFESLKASALIEDLWELADQGSQNDVELGILDSLTWLGDAQREPQTHIAFLKYWSALEALITGYASGKETTRLLNAIPILLAASGPDVPSRSRVDKLYKHRSTILHGRDRPVIVTALTDEISIWAYRSLLVYLSLRKRGYKTREQIYDQAAKLSGQKKVGFGQKAVARWKTYAGFSITEISMGTLGATKCRCRIVAKPLPIRITRVK